MSGLKEYTEKLAGAEELERFCAAEEIGYLNTAEGVPVLIEHLERETSRSVRDAVFQALMRIDADAAIEGSISLLVSDHPQIRNQAVDVLRHKGASAMPFLKVSMQVGCRDVRKLVLDVLIGFQASGVEEIYEAALADPDPNVVITAVENLGKTRARQFRRRIEDILLDAGSHPMLIGACLEALEGIGNEESLAVIRCRFPDLAAMPDFFLAPCLKTLGALGIGKEFFEVAEMLITRNPRMRQSILGALISIHKRHPELAHGDVLLPALRAVAENGDPATDRYRAVRALGFLSSRDDVYSFLISCLTSKERLVRLGAIEALRAGERPEAESALAECARQETDEEVLLAMGR